jgi:hypothetical protein
MEEYPAPRLHGWFIERPFLKTGEDGLVAGQGVGLDAFERFAYAGSLG